MEHRGRTLVSVTWGVFGGVPLLGPHGASSRRLLAVLTLVMESLILKRLLLAKIS